MVFKSLIAFPLQLFVLQDSPPNYILSIIFIQFSTPFHHPHKLLFLLLFAYSHPNAAMEETQSFRLIGNKDIEVIPCDLVAGQSRVYWEDIEQVFPGVKHVKNGKVIVTMMRDPNRLR
jgi:hypothetical protein